MSLLELSHVEVHAPHRAHLRPILRDVSLQVEAGELVAILGARRSGRSTLLRVACGIERPTAGQVRFAGRPIGACGQALGSGIGYCPPLRGPEARLVLGELMAGQLGRGVPQDAARAAALSALERTDALQCAPRDVQELDAAESVRVTIARALTLAPTMLVIDEPVSGVELLQRDRILALLRSLADEGLAVLMSAGEATALAGADRALTLADGELHGSTSPPLAPVVPLRRAASA